MDSQPTIEENMVEHLKRKYPAAARIETDLTAVLADRKSVHGEFNDHARITQELKHVMHSEKGWDGLSSVKREALEMIQHKIGRILAGNSDHADHWLDIEGYARLVRERL